MLAICFCFRTKRLSSNNSWPVRYDNWSVFSNCSRKCCSLCSNVFVYFFVVGYFMLSSRMYRKKEEEDMEMGIKATMLNIWWRFRVSHADWKRKKKRKKNYNFFQFYINVNKYFFYKKRFRHWWWAFMGSKSLLVIKIFKEFFLGKIWLFFWTKMRKKTVSEIQKIR